MIASLGQALPESARRFGDRPALSVGDRTWSFAALDSLSARVARGLSDRGVAPGDRVTLATPNSMEWIAGYYGALRLGAVINPLNTLLTAPEIVYAMRNCGARVLVAPAEKAAAVAAEIPGLLAIATDDIGPGLVSMGDLLAAPADFVPVDVAPDRLSTVGYTSGTTGHPKGAMLSHRAVVMNAAMTAQMHGKSPLDTVVTALPCPHVYGMAVFNGAMMFGLHLVLMPRFDPGEALALIAARRATMFEGVPTMYMRMLAHPDLDRTALGSLTRCTVGGQTMPLPKMEEVERRFGCPLIDLWGMTEIAGLGTTFPSLGPRRLGSVGIALPWTETRIAAIADAGETLPPGEVGELMVRGPTVMQGYWGDEAATRATIEPDGWLHTGDLATRDGEGQVFIVDRRKDLILSGGYNVYPAEIERVVAGHPSVAMVGVGPAPDPDLGEVPKAYVVLRPGAAPDADGIMALCREALAPYKRPRAVAFVEALPTTSTGKIMRRALREMETP